jgi:hypothetical protein
LDYGRLNILERLFVRLIIRAEEGDLRDWNVIHAWADQVHQALVQT